MDDPDDAASVRSMPAVHVTEPSSPAPSPQHTDPALLSTRAPQSPARSSTMQDESSLTQQQRRARHRSAIEVSSFFFFLVVASFNGLFQPRSNRLSGFFTNLIHRRDSPHTSSREPIHEDSAQSEPPPSAVIVSRPPSPPPARPVTPPPPLPAPTLQELGLSLSAMTSDLAPSHFTTPPSSGAFLAPHYLLLCHAQGLDVLPLVSPPAPQPYALVRRVSFKSVVVMEQRGVLVAIAGRRDGVRVYALEEVKKAIEWRIDVEVRRERDRTRRENVKKIALRNVDVADARDSAEKTRKASLSTPPPGDSERIRANLLRKSSQHTLPTPPSPPPVPLIPRSATPRAPKRKPKPSLQIPSHPPPPGPSGHPPPYASPTDIVNSPLPLQTRPSYVSLRSTSRSGSASNVLAAASSHRAANSSRSQDDSKADWAESSDDEAIDVVAAGSSGSHLDERTSATLSSVSSPQLPGVVQPVSVPVPSRNPSGAIRRNRPSNLDLSLTRVNTIPPPEPSPAPTLINLRQALTQLPPPVPTPNTPALDADDDEEEIEGHISLAQALLESRIPDLPPLGTTRPQEPILLTSTSGIRPGSIEPSTPHTADSIGRSSTNEGASRRRRRWSIMISSPTADNDSFSSANGPLTAPSLRSTNRFARSHSFRSNRSQTPTMRSATDPFPPSASSTTLPNTDVAPTPDPLPSTTPTTSRTSRFIPRIISNALHGRRSNERSPAPPSSPIDVGEGIRWTPGANQAPPPKLEYVKLPGTKGAILVKAVETAKKSFLAILCGDNGEKVELFAGTYRTALGLSRTFILPDSPRSLELQLQGDDLVEVFLVFAQNVFGLEPATVRVREVRIGRAERRAARRRARENRPGDPTTNEQEQLDDETNVNVNIGVSVPVASTSTVGADNGYDRSSSPTLVASDHPEAQPERPNTPEAAQTSSASQADELVILATAQMGPYTTFQQLGFAPNFPLASIADEYIIPPTYPSFLEYKAEHETENTGNTLDLTQTQFSPPGLPVPTPTAPPKWYYRDPKNVVHGPWKAALMQAWYKDGLLPPDLPVRREEDTEYMLLKDLRLQSVDPTQPFRVVAPLTESMSIIQSGALQEEQPLLRPISLLEQPRHFGPPALFFSSRGGHSTAIVDARGRSVLKGKFIWSNEDGDTAGSPPSGKMGDIKRLEAFDIEKGSVLVAMRQGGLEVVDLGDALLKPADESRTILPHYNPPLSNVNRRAPFVWKIGTPLASQSSLGNKPSSTTVFSAVKKSSVVSTKNMNTRADTFSGDFDVDPQDEVLYLGRKDDEVYFCERNAASFRILRLSPSTHESY
ncbi:hypothetical protein GALMADRAFT_131877 [Galerina marginata CBS 339.88]|uniref:GYF domain-containing protein n=1 Tax=Galerina marginata (strain CBS 339.88) TaxID=685588 RepID=A0A067TPK4_GALM3|nr:hypothetical protein GALMADRAFT_131877 [Galerina marginata CBS 339.88]